MKQFFIITTLFLTFSYATAQKVYSVDYANQADVKVFFVKYENQAGTNDGKWFFTKYPNQTKKKIFFVEYENQADIKIFFVDYENQAGWQKASKKSLLY